MEVVMLEYLKPTDNGIMIHLLFFMLIQLIVWIVPCNSYIHLC